MTTCRWLDHYTGQNKYFLVFIHFTFFDQISKVSVCCWRVTFCYDSVSKGVTPCSSSQQRSDTWKQVRIFSAFFLAILTQGQDNQYATGHTVKLPAFLESCINFLQYICVILTWYICLDIIVVCRHSQMLATMDRVLCLT